MGVERVGRVRVGQPAGRPQPGQQVGGGAAGQGGAGAREHAGAEPRPAERDAPLEADRHAVAVEHLAQHSRLGRAAADEHGDVLGTHAGAGQLEDLGGDQLGLGALAARLQQPHGAVRRAPAGVRLEQAALEMVQRFAGVGRVVLGAVGEQLVPLGQRLEQLDRRRAAGERRAAGLVGERDAAPSAWRASVSTASRCSGVRSSKP